MTYKHGTLALVIVGTLAFTSFWILGRPGPRHGVELDGGGPSSVSLPPPHTVEADPVEALGPDRTPAFLVGTEVVTRVEVVDQSGRPLSGASVYAVGEGGRLSLGVTDDGCVTARVTPGLLLEAAHAGFRSASMRIEGTAPESIRLILARQSEIRGVLLLEGGQPAGEGLHAIALRGGQRDRWKETMAGPAEGAWRGLSAISDAQGRFEIPVEDADRTYSVTAGGRGLMPKDEIRQVHPDDTDVEIVLHPVFAAVIRLVNEDGEQALRVSDRLWRPGGVSVRCKNLEYKRKALIPNSIEAQLAGVDTSLFDVAGGWLSHATVCTVDREVDVVGPFEMTIDLPGYESTTFEYLAFPLSQGLHQVSIPLRPIAEGWGALQVKFSSAPAGGFLATSPILPVGFLRLVGGGGRKLEFAVENFAAPDLEFAEIPWGRYEASIVSPNGLGRLLIGGMPSVSIEIGADPELLHVDPSNLGAIEVRFSGDAGANFGEKFQAMISMSQGGAGTVVGFRDPPYLIQGLEPGSYQINLYKPFRWRPERTEDAEIVVTAGQVARLTVNAR